MVAAKAHLNSLDDHIRLLQKRIKLSEQKLDEPVDNGVGIQEKPDSTLLYLTDNRLSYSKPLQNEVTLNKKERDLIFSQENYNTKCIFILCALFCASFEINLFNFFKFQVNLKLKQQIEYDPLMNNHVDKSAGDMVANMTMSSSSEKVDSFDNDTMFPEDGNMDSLIDELESVAIEWKSVRGAKECPCSTPLDFATRKVLI